MRLKIPAKHGITIVEACCNPATRKKWEESI